MAFCSVVSLIIDNISHIDLKRKSQVDGKSKGYQRKGHVTPHGGFAGYVVDGELE